MKALQNIVRFSLAKEATGFLSMKNTYCMGLLTDKLAEKQSKKAQQQFKKQIQYMANKPTFTFMDYKQRIHDELDNLKSNIRKKMSQEAKDAEKALYLQKKIMNALFEEELLGDTDVDESVKKEIAIIAEVPIEKVKDTFKKAKSYQKMHRFLRNKQLKGEQLPDSMGELQYQFRQSRYQFTGKERKYLTYRQEKGKGYMRANRARYIKFKK